MMIRRNISVGTGIETSPHPIPSILQVFGLDIPQMNLSTPEEQSWLLWGKSVGYGSQEVEIDDKWNRIETLFGFVNDTQSISVNCR